MGSKPYWKYPRVFKDGRVYVLDEIRFGLPSKELRVAYEQKKARFLQRLSEDVLGRVTPEKKKKPRMTDEEALEILKKKLKGKPTAVKIRALTGVSLHRASVLRELFSHS